MDGNNAQQIMVYETDQDLYLLAQASENPDDSGSEYKPIFYQDLVY